MSLGQDDTMQGLGCGRGCAGAAGPRYQWVQGVDGLGNTVGYWRPTQPLTPGAPYARNAAPFFGEIAEAADGNLYQWVQGVDGLGSPFGFWKRLKRLAKRALPFVQRIAPFVPGGAAALTAATPFLKQAGVAGLGDIGALYAAPDGSLYQVQGVDAPTASMGSQTTSSTALLMMNSRAWRMTSSMDWRTMNCADSPTTNCADSRPMTSSVDTARARISTASAPTRISSGFAAMDPLDGMDADELNGYAAGDDLDGFADDELNGFADDELQRHRR